MAGAVFPQDEPRSTTSAAEVAVWRALKRHLPDGWRAWHSLRLRVGNAWEGEGDFVIAAPERGLLVLEVKGGAIELRDGHWPTATTRGSTSSRTRSCASRGSNARS